MKIESIRALRKREKLSSVIPLEAPYTIRIDPSSICNFKCEFCPNGDDELLEKHNRKKGLMDVDLCCKIIDDLKEFKTKLKRIDFYKDGEPLINKNLPQMIKYAKRQNVADELWITTNGSLLNPKLNRELIDSGLDLIRISVESVSQEGYNKIAKYNIDYKKFIDNIKDLYDNRKKCKIFIKILDWGLTEDEKEKFMNDFKGICDYIFIDTITVWPNEEEYDYTLGKKPEKTHEGFELINKNACPYAFYTLCINYDGKVSVCCYDWTYDTIVGDTKNESIVDIWNGKRLYEFRKMHLTKNRFKHKLCGKCQTLHTLLDSIDEEADDILKRLDT